MWKGHFEIFNIIMLQNIKKNEGGPFIDIKNFRKKMKGDLLETSKIFEKNEKWESSTKYLW